MKKILIFLYVSIISVVCFAQTTWVNKPTVIDPVIGTIVNAYHCTNADSNKGVSLDILVDERYQDKLFLGSSVPFGDFTVNIFTHSIKTKCVVKFYSEDKKVIKEKKYTLNLGTITDNPARKQGEIDIKHIYEYLLTTKGYISISFPTLSNGEVLVAFPHYANQCTEIPKIVHHTDIDDEEDEY